MNETTTLYNSQKSMAIAACWENTSTHKHSNGRIHLDLEGLNASIPYSTRGQKGSS